MPHNKHAKMADEKLETEVKTILKILTAQIRTFCKGVVPDEFQKIANGISEACDKFAERIKAQLAIPSGLVVPEITKSYYEKGQNLPQIKRMAMSDFDNELEYIKEVMEKLPDHKNLIVAAVEDIRQIFDTWSRAVLRKTRDVNPNPYSEDAMQNILKEQTEETHKRLQDTSLENVIPEIVDYAKKNGLGRLFESIMRLYSKHDRSEAVKALVEIEAIYNTGLLVLHKKWREKFEVKPPPLGDTQIDFRGLSDYQSIYNQAFSLYKTRKDAILDVAANLNPEARKYIKNTLRVIRAIISKSNMAIENLNGKVGAPIQLKYEPKVYTPTADFNVIAIDATHDLESFTEATTAEINRMSEIGTVKDPVANVLKYIEEMHASIASAIDALKTKHEEVVNALQRELLREEPELKKRPESPNPRLYFRFNNESESDRRVIQSVLATKDFKIFKFEKKNDRIYKEKALFWFVYVRGKNFYDSFNLESFVSWNRFADNIYIVAIIRPESGNPFVPPKEAVTNRDILEFRRISKNNYDVYATNPLSYPFDVFERVKRESTLIE